jgi:CRP-like cAMP-binding protein
VHQRLRELTSKLDRREQFSILRRLKFFHDFSQSEILEVLRASTWQNYAGGDEIVKEGEMDDRFYVIVSGTAAVMRGGRGMGSLETGDCFGETSYVRGARRLATIMARSDVTLMKVSSTLLEQASASCQLRFNKVFLRSLIGRLQSPD